MPTAKEKFDAAVDVVHSLPKEGSHSPSNDVKLKFYSYYKQATEGKCNKPAPYFWDVINKAKWSAWNDLGDLSQEEAMKRYVEELLKLFDGAPTDEAGSELKAKIELFIKLAKQ